MDIIFNRRSVRSYSEKPVEAEKKEKLLRAAMQAPSAGNQQPWEFIVVEERKNLIQLSKMSQYSQMIAKAPLAIVLLGNEARMKFAGNWQQDMGAAAENMLLEAAYIGLGAVWLGVYPMEDRMEKVKKQFELPEGITPFSVISIGYPAEENANHFVERFDKSRIHEEKW